MKYWSGSRVEAEGRMARSEGGASPQWAVTTERRRQLPFCLAPSTVALILALAFVARWGRDRCGYRHCASRLGQRQNPQQRGPLEYFNSLLDQFELLQFSPARFAKVA